MKVSGLDMSELLGAGALSKAIGVSTKTIYNYYDRAQSHADNPFEPGRPLRAHPERVRQWVMTVEANRTGPSGPKLKMSKSSAGASPVAETKKARASSDGFIDLAGVEKDLSGDGSVDDLASLRFTASKLEALVNNFDMERMGDKQVARLYSNYTDVLSKLYGRIAQLEVALIDLKLKRGEVITIEQSAAISETLVNCLYVNVDKLVQDAIDRIKEEEIAVHGASKIDSEKLLDLCQELVDNFKLRCHEDFLKAVPEKEGDDNASK